MENGANTPMPPVPAEEVMTHAARFRAVMDFKPVDRLPRVEWAAWWDKTVLRWTREGLALSKSYEMPDNRLDLAPELARQFGLDFYRQHWFHPWDGRQSKPASHGAGIVAGADDYERELPHLYPSNDWLHWAWKRLELYQEEQSRNDSLLWITIPGFFAWPRRLFGIEGHFYAFYDEPELMHRMNRDVADWTLRILRQTATVARPVFATIGEDMSYNHGPMLSRQLFDEFLAPYYRMVVPVLKELGIRVFVDSDGDVTNMIPWFEGVGVEGVLPLERQASVDGMAIREKHPRFGLIGHFDKLTMSKGEAAMRAEFERLAPLARSGGFIPSVDHQTPPEVPLADYRLYMKLLREFTAPEPAVKRGAP